MLNEFVIQFDKAVDTRIAVEEDEDFKTMNSKPFLSSIHPIEAKAGSLLVFILFLISHFSANKLPHTYNFEHYFCRQMLYQKDI